MSKHIKWTSIESMHNLRRSLNAYKRVTEGFEIPEVLYKTKVKLHGTNAGIQIHSDGKVVSQSRTRILNAGHNDNKNFAVWVKKNEETFSSLAADNYTTTIFGEWCGEGINNGVAITQIKRKIFAVFAVQLDKTLPDGSVQTTLHTSPLEIERIVNCNVEGMYVLPWHTAEVRVNWSSEKKMERSADKINEFVSEVEKCDPWVKETFGVEGIGEGLVLYPVELRRSDKVETNLLNKDQISSYMFKAKGEKHKVVKQKKPAQISPEIAKDVQEFVDLFLTDARLEQGVQESCQGKREMKYTGKFVMWIVEDVQKESSAELEASNLTWEDVRKEVARKASEWYRDF